MMRSCYMDIGNSRIKLWLCEGTTLIASHAFWHQQSLALLGSDLPIEFYQSIDFIGISSVLSAEFNQQLSELCLSLWQCTPSFARTDFSSLGIKCAYDEPHLLGIDRWLNILAVANRQPVCVVSCGTALTIDVVQHNQHLGGYIMPGVNLQLSSLIQGTQRVRPHAIKQASVALGKNTSEAVHHGILLMTVAMIEKVYTTTTTMTAEPVSVVLTGGDAENLSPHLQIDHDIMPELLLLGLQRYFGHS